jgi:S-adenosylmethionine synthetase
MISPLISTLEICEGDLEIVERKGLGHPDTICDALAETFSRNLCREYRRRFGEILHHNVDKALLCGGSAAPAFGGGTVLSPITVFLAGRAVVEANSERIPVEDIAVEGSRAWLRANLHGLDADRHVQIHPLVHPGAQDLRAIFARGSENGVPRANDTSVGVGYAPLSRLERLVLQTERLINDRDRNREHPAWGEDVKVMGVRSGDAVRLTIACAMIGRHLAHIDDYLAEKAAIERTVRDLAIAHGFSACSVGVNTGDDPARGSVYLTVTGTSAEAGDDGQVGRGNRVNGLITPCRPMSLEAAAGKNPVTHVGKIYNIVAQRMAATLVEAVPEIAAAQCFIVSQIGAPVAQPAVLQIKIATHDGMDMAQLRPRVEEVAVQQLGTISALVDDFVEGRVGLF